MGVHNTGADLSHAVAGCPVRMLLLAPGLQVPCRGCSRLIAPPSNRTQLCLDCRHAHECKEEQQPATTSAPAQPPAPPSPPIIFSRPTGCIDPLSLEQRAAVVTLDAVGFSRPAIASTVHTSLNTVGKWVRRWGDTHILSDAERSGRPRCTDSETDEAVGALAEEKKFVTPKGIKRELQLAVSARTVRRRLGEVGLHGFIARPEYPFTERQLQQRLSFGSGYANWCEQDWERVLFSDETYIELGPHGQTWVQRPLGEALNPTYMTHRVPHPARVSLWGCFSAKEVGQAEIWVGEFDAQRYKSVLADSLLPSARSAFPSGQWWLLHDNSPQHCSHVAQGWLFNKCVQCLDFPPWSPDLNPIENLWHDLKRRVEACNARTTDELELHLKEEWEATPQSFLARLAHSMPQRCRLVQESGGHKIKY